MKNIKQTRDLYQAAYWLCMGGKVMNTTGNYPKTNFFIKVNNSPKYIIRRIFHYVDWKEYKNNRLYIKSISVNGAMAKSSSMKEILEIWKKAKEE